MGSLKRKEGPGGASAPKTAKSTTEPRPSKRPKPSESTKPAKDEARKGAKEPKASSDPKPAPFVSQLKEEEPLFPRGGGSVLTPLEQKQISIQAKKDVLFEEARSSKGDKAIKKLKRRKSRADDASAKVVDEDAVKVESLNFKVGHSWSGQRTARLC